MEVRSVERTDAMLGVEAAAVARERLTEWLAEQLAVDRCASVE